MRNKQADPVDVYVGERLRLRRRQLGLNQHTIGDRLGLSYQQIQKYEKGLSRIGASRLFRLSRMLGVPVEFCFDDMPMEVTAGSKQLAVAVADGATPTPQEMRRMVRAYSRLPAPRVRRQIVSLIKAVAWDCFDD